MNLFQVFIVFSALAVVALIVLVFFIAPRWGDKNVLIYIFICSILGSFTVMSCKGLSLGIKELFSGTQSISSWFILLFAFLLIVCVIIQMNYLNKALDIYNTPIVTTVYYVLFTLFVMAASAILFKEFLNISFTDVVGMLCGFATIVCALFLIQFFKTDKEKSEKSGSTKKKKTTDKAKSFIKSLFRDGVAPGDSDASPSSTTGVVDSSPIAAFTDLNELNITSTPTTQVRLEQGGLDAPHDHDHEAFNMRVIDSDRQVWSISC